MATNYIEAGHRANVTLTASAVSGVPMAYGNGAGIPITSGAIGDTIALALTGVWVFDTDATIAAGDKVDYDNATSKVVATTTGDLDIGVAFKADSGGKVHVLLNDKPGIQKAP